MSRPDFGVRITECAGINLACRYAVPGLTLHDLVMIFDKAKAQAEPGDDLSGNPALWPDVRGVSAVVEAVMAAIYPESE